MIVKHVKTLKKIVKNYKLEPRLDFVSKIEATDFEIDDLPGQGPSKPWPDADDITHEQLENVVDEANILLDEIQENAILSNQPLLIDGLAGTGKTSIIGTIVSNLWEVKKSAVLFSAANLKSSSPRAAIRALFAETTALPCSSAAFTRS